MVKKDIKADGQYFLFNFLNALQVPGLISTAVVKLPKADDQKRSIAF
jgi:hypothetical protein